MKRYHKQVFFPSNTKLQLEKFTDILNVLKWQVTGHSIEHIRYTRYMELHGILSFIKGLELDYSNIFEYYTDNTGLIAKACYRLNYTDNLALILVIGQGKSLITIYCNDKTDNHNTLNRSLYIQG